MTRKRMLVGTSLLSVLLLSFHLAQDAIHAKAGTIEAGAGSLTAILILVVLLSGPPLLAERRAGRPSSSYGACSRSASTGCSR